jgi:hypothetical protein
MKKTLILIAGLFLIFSGCIELEEKISIRKDGSGYYKVKQVLSTELTSMMQMGMKGGSTKSDLPLSQKELEQSFQGEGVKIKSSSFKIKDGRLKGEYRIDFKNVKAFFNVPAMHKRFRFYKKGNRLVLKSIPKSNIKPDARQFSPPLKRTSSSESMAIPQMNQLSDQNKDMEAALQESMKKMLSGFKVAISVELPNKIMNSNATQRKGRLAKWTFDEKMFADLEKMKSLDDSLWVECSLKGLSFIPPKEEDILPVKGSQLKKNAFPSPHSASAEAPQPAAKLNPVTPKSSPPDISGGRSIIDLKNGNSIEVDGYYKEGDMYTFIKHGGTFSLPKSIVKSVRTPDYE